MKKTLGIMAALLIASAFVASAAEVWSQNAVGYIQIEAEANELYALSYPFDVMGTGTNPMAFTNTPLAQEAAVNSMVYFWNGSSWAVGQYEDNRGNLMWTGAAAAKDIIPGECFFYKPAADQMLLIAGQVPDDIEFPLDIAGAGNLSAIANPYPTTVKFTDSELADGAAVNSMVYFWNGSSWAVGQYEDNRGNLIWTGAAADGVLTPGQGIFFKAPVGESEKTVTFKKGYDWP